MRILLFLSINHRRSSHDILNIAMGHEFCTIFMLRMQKRLNRKTIADPYAHRQTRTGGSVDYSFSDASVILGNPATGRNGSENLIMRMNRIFR